MRGDRSSERYWTCTPAPWRSQAEPYTRSGRGVTSRDARCRVRCQRRAGAALSADLEATQSSNRARRGPRGRGRGRCPCPLRGSDHRARSGRICRLPTSTTSVTCTSEGRSSSRGGYSPARPQSRGQIVFVNSIVPLPSGANDVSYATMKPAGRHSLTDCGRGQRRRHPRADGRRSVGPHARAGGRPSSSRPNVSPQLLLHPEDVADVAAPHFCSAHRRGYGRERPADAPPPGGAIRESPAHWTSWVYRLGDSVSA